MDRAKLELASYGLDLLHEARDRPQVRVLLSRPVGSAASELIVEDNPQLVARQFGQPVEVVVADARSAMEYEQRLCCFAHRAIVDAVPSRIDDDAPLMLTHRDSLSSVVARLWSRTYSGGISA